ncbi:PREDICTED: F-box [Prunus dulcis]|uniref:PREDICTED: F-box n=1 Tax=Prunus dulcis TaxID=3755 RepID=A0A5E4FZZ5_PRUDU|nr:PREDICTED: F-box [Prunus dulcis]
MAPGYQRRKSKEKTGRVTKGPKLPFEMITEILSWLTVDALLRVKSASKKWCSLIEDHHHIVKHMNLASPLPKKCRYRRMKCAFVSLTGEAKLVCAYIQNDDVGFEVMSIGHDGKWGALKHPIQGCLKKNGKWAARSQFS